MYIPLFVGVLCLSLFWYSLFCLHYSCAITLMRKRALVALLLLSFRCLVKCCVALPHGVVGWSAVCDILTFAVVHSVSFPV